MEISIPIDLYPVPIDILSNNLESIVKYLSILA